MRKYLLCLSTWIILVLTACTNVETVPVHTMDEEVYGTGAETNIEPYPLVIERVYLATDEIIDQKVILLIEATNVGDEPIEVGKIDFELRHKEDDKFEFIRVHWASDEIVLQPGETNVLFNFQQTPDDFPATSFDPSEFEVQYIGDYFDHHQPMPIQTDIPAEYQELVEERVTAFKNHEDEQIEFVDETGDDVEYASDPIRITAYELSQRGTAYIHVENLTDEPFYFAPKYVSIFDHQFAYEVDTRVSDPDFANGIIIPPHDRLEYREFFFISGERHPASDEIAGRIIGVCYKTEWPMADEYDIIGAYEEERPLDFVGYDLDE